MSKNEIISKLYDIEALTVNMEADKGRKCKRFFEIIHHIRVSVQIMLELIKRIEDLEDQINNLNVK